MSRTVTLVSAHPHALKSLSWLYASLEVVHTKRVFGLFDAPDVDSVLFIETEDPEWLVTKRIQGFAKGLGLKPGDTPGFHYTCPGPFKILDEIKKLRGTIEQYQLKLIVLSTLQNLLIGQDWKSQQEMAPIMAELIDLSRECSIVLLTHSPHDKRQKRAAGTITLGANCATHIHYEKLVTKKSTSVYVQLDSKVGAGESGFTMTLGTDPTDPDQVSCVRSITYLKPGRLMSGKDAVRQAIADNPKASTAEVAEILGKTTRYVQQIKKELREQGDE